MSAPSNKKQRLFSAYQRHLDVLKITGIVLMVFAIIAVLIISRILSGSFRYREDAIYTFFVIAFFSFIAGIIISVIASIEQNKADVINERLYAVWKYKPETIYTFYRKMCRYEKKTKCLNFLAGALATLAIGLILYFNKAGHYVGIIFLLAGVILLICAVIALPYVQYLLLKLRTRLFGDAKEIIFSRGGIWYCGKVCFFGDRGITYHRVERKEIHGQDAIVFYYTRTTGFQQTARELAIPVAPKMSYAADALVEEFNRSDLLTKDQKSYRK